MTGVPAAAWLAALLAVSAAEYRKAEGTWHVAEMAMNGYDIPPEGFKDLRLVLKGDVVKAFSGEELIAEGRYRVAGVKGRRVAFDLTMSVGPDKGKTFPALNEWADADTLRTCIAQPGKPRPAGFAPEKGDRQAVFVIKRARK